MAEYPAYVCTPEVRWSDQDLLGHVNNARVITLIEEARIQWLRDAWDRTDVRDRPTLVARMELNYRRPVVYGPQLSVELGVGRVGRSSYTITCRGIQDGRVAFDGLTVMVMVDAETGEPTALSERERELLGRYGSFDPEDPTRLD
ncbi:acyl-CoA thioesterase [Amycolatopsis sp. H6(2020)]|uniref:acyl-CoA thioesterase n=1 Tax=Rothia kristinae TaxID=37923 RepID=UPI0011A685CF|nr:thioesterase family protein [Rothia kristinae]MBE8527790.1 acyl-CoA thioesterase [Amycolatopsis sp. H6(2020)]